MTRLFAILVTALCIFACAAPGSPTGSQPVPVTDAQQETNATTQIESIEPPSVEPTEIPIAAAGKSPNDRICRRERRTGTHIAARVCRTRAEIQRMEEAGRDTFDDLHREQSFTDQVDPTGRH